MSQVASDDPEAVELMTNISEQLSSEKLTNQQQALLDDQLARQEALDRQFAEDGRKLEKDMEEERVKQGSAVDQQIDQQLKLVSRARTLGDRYFIGLIQKLLSKTFSIKK